jgi:hypothetical protein
MKYIVKGFREMMAREALEKAKADSNLSDRIFNLEKYIKGLGG